MKNANWLEDDIEFARKRHGAGQLTDWEYEQMEYFPRRGWIAKHRVAQRTLW